MNNLSNNLYIFTTPASVEKTKTSINKLQLVFLVGLSLILLLLRLNGHAPISNYLWAEDGPVFINQAESLGIAALWQSYAGYLHLYPRIIALIANQFSLIYRTELFFLGSLLAYIFSLAVIIQQIARFSLGFLPLIFFILIIGLQPNMGEVFFTLTNAQWFLGTAFCIWALSNKPMGLPRFVQLMIWMLVGLTGPFALMLVPVLIVKAIILKDLKPFFLSYAVVFCCAIIQMVIIITFLKHHGDIISTSSASLYTWLRAFVHIGLFNVNSPSKLIAAALFWFVFIISLLNRKFQPQQDKSLIVMLLYFFIAGIIILAALYKVKDNPMNIVEFGSGNRYTWIAFTLILSGITIATRHQQGKQLLLAALILLIFKQDIHLTLRDSLQFKSFLNFSNYESVSIPLNPQGPIYPSWQLLEGPSNKNISLATQFNLSLSKLSLVNITSHQATNQQLSLTWQGNNPYLLYPERIFCGQATDIGLKVDIEHSSPGWTQIFWSNSQNFSEKKSLKIWYPVGRVTAQYAFPNSSSGIYLRLDPLDVLGSAIIHKITVYCLP